MNIIVIGDDDSLIGHLDAGDVDLLLSVGDLHDSSIEKAIAYYRPKKIFAVRGNHDSNMPFPSWATSLHSTIESFQGITFGGFNGSWRYKPRGNYLYDQEQVSQMLCDFPHVDIFVAHNCPRGIHERDEYVHQGFVAFLDYIERTSPVYFIHGHQHIKEITQYGKTTIIGIFGETIIHLDKN